LDKFALDFPIAEAIAMELRLDVLAALPERPALDA
jgi:hypothetical protein